MSSYGSGRKAIYESIERYHTINVKSARCFGYQITYSEQKNVVGRRPWIICPCCQRRCGLLYFRLDSWAVCRECLHLIYPSQRETYEEKQKTYERYILEEGAYEEWMRLKKRYLSYAEADRCYQKWNFKMMLELLKLQADTMRVLVKMLPEEKQVEIESRIVALEKNKQPTTDDIDRTTREIEELYGLIAA